MMVKRARYATGEAHIPGEEDMGAMQAGTEPEVKWAGRDVVAEVTGKERIPGRTIQDLVPFDAPEGKERASMSHEEQEEWDNWQNQQKVRLDKLVGEAKRSYQIASSTQNQDAFFEDVLPKLKEIDELANDIGRPARKGFDPGARADVEPTAGPSGEINIHEGFVWTKKAADLALNKNHRTIPTVEDFANEAKTRNDKAKIYDDASQRLASLADRKSSILQKQLGSEAGVAGPLRPFTSIREGLSESKADILDPKNFTTQGVLKAAREAGVPFRRITETIKTGEDGWLSPDGKAFVPTGVLSHDDVAKTLFPDVDKVGSASRSLMANGWIRKVSNTDLKGYDINKPTEPVISNIEMDMVKNGLYGQPLKIDFRGPSGTRSIDIEGGWEDLGRAVREQLKAMKYQPAEMGMGGVEVMGRAAGISLGAGLGAKLGAPFGVPGMAIGGTVGGFIGAVSPDLIGRPAFKFAARNLMPFLRDSGTSLHDYFSGPPIKSRLPDMQGIAEERQHAVDGIGPTHIERAMHFPQDFFQKFADRIQFISDKPGFMSRWTADLFNDPRGAAFRDASGKIKVDNSPYVSARLAMGQMNGNVSELHRGFTQTQREAIKYGGNQHLTDLRDYLDLNNYARVIEVKQEDIAAHQENIQSWQTKLQSANITPAQEAALHSDINKATDELRILQKKMASGAFNPKGFTSDKIAQNLQQLQQSMGEADFNHMKGLADRTWEQIRKVTDDLHRYGLMTDAAYQKFTTRENQYIPMYRIMTDLASGVQRRLDGAQSPLYLMHENVIRTLEGSERTNQDPFVAASKFAMASYREIFRNKVMQDYVTAGKTDSGIGDYFQEVSRGTRPKQGYGIVGMYEKGIQKTYMVPDWLSSSLENAPIAARTALGDMMGWSAKAFKAGATGKNLAFLLPNAASHFMRMAIMSEGGVKVDFAHPVETAGSAARLLGSWLKTIATGAKNDPSFSDYVKGGAAWSVQQRMISPEHFLDFNNLGWKRRVSTGRILDYVQDLNAAWEDATRLTCFKNLREQGYSSKAASWEVARFGGGPDFSHMGAWMPELNLASMFFNAHLQYLFNDLHRIAENPRRIIPIFAAATAMAMAQAQWNWSQKDEKGEPLMRSVRSYDRDNYFVVLTGRQIQDPSTGGLTPERYRLRKPDYAKFFINPIENAINKMVGRDDRTGTQIGLDAASSWLPGQYQLQASHVAGGLARGLVSSANPIIRIPAELGMNQTSFGPIVPQREQNIESQYQIGPTTSPTAVAIGGGGLRGAEAGGMWGAALGEFVGGHKGALAGGTLGAVGGAIGMSPRRADYVIKSIGGGLSQEATTVTDPFFGGFSQSRLYKGNEVVKNIPFLGPILGRFVTPGGNYPLEKASQEFYEGLQKAQQQKATFDLLIKQDPQKAYQYQRQSGDLMFKLGVATEISQRVAALRQMQDQVSNSKDLSEKQRDEYLQRIFQARLSMLQAGTRIWKPAASPSPSNSRGTGNAER
jgi:hypothetical protein